MIAIRLATVWDVPSTMITLVVKFPIFKILTTSENQACRIATPKQQLFEKLQKEKYMDRSFHCIPHQTQQQLLSRSVELIETIQGLHDDVLYVTTTTRMLCQHSIVMQMLCQHLGIAVIGFGDCNTCL